MSDRVAVTLPDGDELRVVTGRRLGRTYNVGPFAIYGIAFDDGSHGQVHEMYIHDLAVLEGRPGPYSLSPTGGRA